MGIWTLHGRNTLLRPTRYFHRLRISTRHNFSIMELVSHPFYDLLPWVDNRFSSLMK